MLNIADGVGRNKDSLARDLYGKAVPLLDGVSQTS